MATTTKRKTTKATPATKKPARKVAHMGGTAAVNAYMAALVHPQKEVIEAVRAIVLKADKRMAERVKWNAPSFYITDASGTAQDFAAFNPRAKGFVQLILLFPMGVVDDPARIMQGDWKDRREARFLDAADVRTKKNSLSALVKAWVHRMD